MQIIIEMRHGIMLRVDDMQFGLCLDDDDTDAVFIF